MGVTHKIRPGAEPTTNDTAIAMLRLVLLASLAAAVSAMPQMIYNGQYVYPTVQYAVQPTVQYVQPATVQAAEPKVEYKPTTYVAQPAAEPLFFNNMGFGRYPLNDGWMLWDEDLRDKDTPKAGKIGSYKDGG